MRQVVNAPPRVVLPVLFKSHFNHLSLLFQINCLITTQFRVRRITLPVQKSCQLLARKYSPMSASTVAAAVSGSLDCPLLTAAGRRAGNNLLIAVVAVAIRGSPSSISLVGLRQIFWLCTLTQKSRSEGSNKRGLV